MKFLFFLTLLPCIIMAQNDTDAFVTSIETVSVEEGKYIFHCTVRNTSDKIKNVTFQVGQLWKDISKGADVQTFVMEDMQLATSDKTTLSIIKDDSLRVFRLRLAPNSESQLLLRMTCRNKGFLAYDDPKNMKPTELVVTIDPKKPEVRPDMEALKRCFSAQQLEYPLSEELDFNTCFVELVMQRFKGQGCLSESELVTMKSKISTQIHQKAPNFRLGVAPLNLDFDISVDDRIAPITFHNIKWTTNGVNIKLSAEMCFGNQVQMTEMQDFKAMFPCLF